MKLTVIVDDSTVIIDGEPLNLDLTPFNLDGVHAIQWGGVQGEIEYKDRNKPNKVIDEIASFAGIIAAHSSEKQKRIDDNAAEIAARPAPTIRDKRQSDYIKELSPEGTFEKTIGDIVDALIKNAKGDSAELDALIVKIEAIKARHPG